MFAKNEIVFSEKGLDQIEQRIGEVEQKANGLLSRLPLTVQREWKKAAEAMKLESRYMVTGAIKDFASAATAPAKVTFADAINKAYAWRKEMTSIAVSTGLQFESADTWVKSTAKRIAQMPMTV